MIYRGRRSARPGSDAAGPGLVTFSADGVSRELLPPRNDVINHSPDGFQWGYGGSGPSQLALALCIDATGDVDRAVAVYQDFKREFVARIQADEWVIDRDRVLAIIAAIEAEARQ